MNFKEALKVLNITEFEQRILNSNSHGELFHCLDYIQIAGLSDVSWFREWFLEVVQFAENEWSRPESVFQHIPRMLQESAS